MAGRKIIVSYKYADDNVENLSNSPWCNSTVRDYVDLLESYIDDTDHIFKGESDGEDLSAYSEETIREKLRDRIYDSTLTIVMISPNMKDALKDERSQWIPWEISFSLKETSRRNSSGQSVTSRANAMLAIVLPDSFGAYSYYLESRSCCSNNCVTHHTGQLFEIIRRNKFNKIAPDSRSCARDETIWYGEASYIEAVKWVDFAADPEKYISAAYDRRDRIDSFDIRKTF